MTKLFTGTIVGGPKDGLYLDFETNDIDKCVDALKAKRRIRLESHGHTYRVEDFNETSKTCVLIYESALVP